MTAHRSFTYGNDRIEYDVTFVPVTHTKISIHVHSNGSVQVDAPEGRLFPEIHAAVLKRAGWIKGHLDACKRQRGLVLPRTYTSGESHFYLGRRFQLKVKDTSGSAQGVKLLRGQICIETPSRDAIAVRDCLSAWYRCRAADVFARRMEEIAEGVGSDSSLGGGSSACGHNGAAVRPEA